ncbi:siderophore esterase [Penicillium brevicompactum]|uniref:Siderophore esterase n=1 Tax=Penicillium brevicompactum TaxID=5074 RepID=A0A9W9Q528_PENBR|nr:siderophore esterase [Penicillium brevicompactum]
MQELPMEVPLPSSEQLYMKSAHDDLYLVQISWPLSWQNGRFFEGSAPIIYIVDGNALFLTATEAAWRRAAESRFVGGVVVAIGYPLTGKLYDSKRRSFDLTPPTATPIPGFGGADRFLDFIEGVVKPHVKARFPHVSISREALYGHSYGGLLALHTLFTRTNSFDCYIASSPSVWWNDHSILETAKTFLAEEQRDETPPSLMVFWGSLEENPIRWDDESSDQFESRKHIASIFRTSENSVKICEVLQGSHHLRTILMHEFIGEEHTSVMACSMNRGLTQFFEDWPLSR